MTIRTKPNTPEYSAGFDRIFTKQTAGCKGCSYDWPPYGHSCYMFKERPSSLPCAQYRKE